MYNRQVLALAPIRWVSLSFFSNWCNGEQFDFRMKQDIYIRLAICAIEIYIVNIEKDFNASSASLEMFTYSIYNHFANHSKRVCFGQSAVKFFRKLALNTLRQKTLLVRILTCLEEWAQSR